MNAPLTTEEAWKWISQMGWGTKSTDFATIATEWFGNLGKAKMKELERFVNERVADLYRAVEQFEVKYGLLECGSDDGYSDLRYHIVGLGKAEFDKCMANPREIERRHFSDDYRESFIYCFQEPEPERTEADKAKTMEDFADAMLVLDRQISTLQMALDAVTTKWAYLYQLGRQIQKDRKGQKTA